MAAVVSHIIPGLAATALAIAGGLALYVFNEYQSAVEASHVDASSVRLQTPGWDRSIPHGLTGEALAHFDKGMEAYGRGDYTEASSWLYRAATASPGLPAVHFYLGVSYLKTRDTMAGIRELKTVLGLARGEYETEARLHLAHALIERGDSASAREYVAPVVALGGETGARARALIQASYPRAQ